MEIPKTPGNPAVSWWSVHEWVTPRMIEGHPLLGTPAWCALTDDNPAKLSAVLDGGRHWALRLEMNQEALAEASKAVAAAADWRGIAQELITLSTFRANHPWARREAS